MWDKRGPLRRAVLIFFFCICPYLYWYICDDSIIGQHIYVPLSCWSYQTSYLFIWHSFFFFCFHYIRTHYVKKAFWRGSAAPTTHLTSQHFCLNIIDCLLFTCIELFTEYFLKLGHLYICKLSTSVRSRRFRSYCHPHSILL